MKKNIIGIFIFILLLGVIGCNKNAIIKDDTKKIKKDKSVSIEEKIYESIFCNEDGENMECLSFIGNSLKMGSYYYYENEFINVLNKANTYTYKVSGSKIESELDISYDKESDNISYNNKIYKRKENLIKSIIEVYKPLLSDNFTETDHSYCTKKFNGMTQSNYFECYTFRYDNTVDIAEVDNNETLTNKKLYSISKKGTITLYNESDEYAEGRFYKFDEENLILSYKEDFSEGNTSTYIKCDDPEKYASENLN